MKGAGCCWPISIRRARRRYIVSVWSCHPGDRAGYVCLWPVTGEYHGTWPVLCLDDNARPLTLSEWQAQQRLRAQERLVRRLACLRGVWIADPETARARVRDWAGDTALWQEQAA